jgi:prephenate dehydrogenase
MRIAVLGVGLIGGSIGLAARERAGAEVAAYDPDAHAAAAAVERGAADRACTTVAEALDGSEAAFATAPVGALPELVGEILRHARRDCVVSDVGSTKRAIVAAHDDDRFVGGHPLAGAETSGIEHARGDLFAGATWYLTPTARTSGVLYERLHRLLRSLGAVPAAIDAASHDTLLALASHLPHVFANVLVAGLASRGGEEGRTPAVGPSFRDATRVAGAPSAIWTDIYLSNADALSAAIDEAVASLQRVRTALMAGDEAGITDWNDTAAAERRRLIDAPLAGATLQELRVSVPNRPGVLAQLALELGRAGVNIDDMALYPAPDMSAGVVALWVAGEHAAARAAELIAGLGFPVARAEAGA